MKEVKSLKPAGHRVLVKPDKMETVSRGGIVLPENDKFRKEQAQIAGTLIEVGSQAWKAFCDGEQWAKTGDRVLFAKFAGYEVIVEGELHRVMNDEDITAIIQEG